MISRRGFTVSVLALVCAVLGGSWYFQPERRLHRSWDRLIEVVEARHARALGGQLSPDYSDRWGYTRESLIADARMGFQQFESLSIRVDDATFSITDDEAIIRAHLRIDARGSRQVIDARVAANALFSPFVFRWTRSGSFPWAWELAEFDQPEFDLTRYRRSLTGL